MQPTSSQAILITPFEHMIVFIVSANLCKITLVVLYRARIPACAFPRATTPNEFPAEFDSLLEVVCFENNILIVGSLNYDWVGQKHHSIKQKLQSIQESLDLTQQVCEPTHFNASTLDYVISLGDEEMAIASFVIYCVFFQK